MGNYANYLGVFAPLSMVGLWTISVEAQFYFAFGGVLAVRRQARAAVLIAPAIGIFIVKLCFLPLFIATSHMFYFEILILSSAACSVRAHIRPSAILVVLAFVYVLAFPQLPRTLPLFAISYPALAIAVAYIAVCAGAGFRFVRENSAQDKAMLWIGERSYIIYVLHFQILSITGMVMQWRGGNYTHPTAYAVVLMIAPIVAAPIYSLVYNRVEQPGIELGRRWAERLRYRVAPSVLAS